MLFGNKFLTTVILIILTGCSFFSENSNFAGEWRPINVLGQETVTGKLVFGSDFKFKLKGEYVVAEDDKYLIDLDYQADFNNYEESLLSTNKKITIGLLKTNGQYLSENTKTKKFKQTFYTGEDLEKNKMSLKFYLNDDFKLMWESPDGYLFYFERAKK